MSNKGWISLHRSVTDHWLFDEDRKFSKFEAWIDLLLMVNHTDKKMMLGNELITIKEVRKLQVFVSYASVGTGQTIK